MIPVVTLVVAAEATLRLTGFRFAPEYLSDPVFDSASDGRLQTARMFTADEPYGFPFCFDQTFEQEKGDQIRVVIVGASSVFNLGKAPRLNEKLRAQFNNDVEIINASFQACGSERMLLTVQEMVSYSPDLFVIYFGHNEFVSAANPATRIDEKGEICKPTQTNNIRLMQFLAKLKQQISPPSIEALEGMRRPYSNLEKEAFYDRYRSHLVEIVETARHHGAKVVLSTVCYNYQIPPRSANGFDRIDRLRGLTQADLFSLDKQHPNNAFVEYILGANAIQAEDYSAAKEFLENAFLHDVHPNRADRKINAIIRSVADDYNCPLADVKKAVDSQNSNAIPGFELFNDHCHLNDRGNAILEDTIVAAIAAQDN